MGVSTIFVDNLPFQIRKIWVHNLFARYGKVKEVVIPNKRSKVTGQSFGFVRFFNEDDARSAIAASNNTWCWGKQLNVKRPKFLLQKDHNESHSHYADGHPKGRGVSGQVFSKQRGSKNPQFEREKGNEVWRRKGVPESSKQGEERNHSNQKTQRDIGLETIELQSSGCGWLYRSAVGKIKRMVSYKYLLDVFSKEGVKECQIKPAGGRLMLITFPHEKMRDEVIKKSWLENWFEEIKPWNEDPAHIERFVWLECYGMPLNSWNVQSFKVLANKWGQYLKVDEDTLNGNSFVKAKVLIVTEMVKKIDDQVQVLVNGKKYMVWVKEVDSYRVIEPEREKSKEKEDEVERNGADKDARVDRTLQSEDDRESIEKNNKGPEKMDEVDNRNEGEKLKTTTNGEDLVAQESEDMGNSQFINALTVYNTSLGDIRNQMVKEKRDVQIINGGSRKSLFPRSSDRQLEPIMEEEEESFVDESPDMDVNGQVEEGVISENANHKKYPEEYWNASKEHGQSDLNVQPTVPKVLTARQRRAKLRKEIRDICDSLDEGTQVGDVWEEDRDHSESIDSEDIQRRNNIILKGFEEAVQVGKRIGIVFHESDEVVINRLAQA